MILTASTLVATLTLLATPTPPAPDGAEARCQKKDARACAEAGAHHAGKQTPEGYQKAAGFLLSACELHDVDSCKLVGLLFEHEDAKPPKDPPKPAPPPVAQLTKECKGGNAQSCAWLGEHHEKKGKAADLKKAAGLYERGCKAKSGYACLNLGALYSEGKGVKKDEARARGLVEKSCELKDGKGCLDASNVYLRGTLGAATDEKKAAAFLDQGCELGEHRACHNLGILYGQGRGVPVDEAKGVSLLDRACTAGGSLSCESLGIRYRDGKGVKKDARRAADYFIRNCKRGDYLACLNASYALEGGGH